jgi:hypothetical protein
LDVAGLTAPVLHPPPLGCAVAEEIPCQQGK